MSKLGFVTKISIYFIILISYMLLQKLQQNRETDYRAVARKVTWEECTEFYYSLACRDHDPKPRHDEI